MAALFTSEQNEMREKFEMCGATPAQSESIVSTLQAELRLVTFNQYFVYFRKFELKVFYESQAHVAAWKDCGPLYVALDRAWSMAEELDKKKEESRKALEEGDEQQPKNKQSKESGSEPR